MVGLNPNYTHLPCTEIVGQTADLKPILCMKPGIQIGSTVKCKKHWAKSRGRATWRRSREKRRL